MEISNGSPPPMPPRSPTADPPALGARIEAELAMLEDSHLSFACVSDATLRDLMRYEWRIQLERYLADGFLAEADPDCPVMRHVDSAVDADGVVPDEINLVLREGVEVFGYFNTGQVNDCYYLHVVQPGSTAFFTVSIESGNASDGPYDIHVSPAGDWGEFRARLPVP